VLSVSPDKAWESLSENFMPNNRFETDWYVDASRRLRSPLKLVVGRTTNDYQERHHDREARDQPICLAMLHNLGFSAWVESTELQTILDAYHTLIERSVLRPNEKGSLSTVRLRRALFAVGGPPHYAYFSDTILLWCPLVPPAVADFVDVVAILYVSTFNEYPSAVPSLSVMLFLTMKLDSLSESLSWAHHVERGQEWVGLTFGKSAVWSPFCATPWNSHH
jgi:hypothetical protein